MSAENDIAPIEYEDLIKSVRPGSVSDGENGLPDISTSLGKTNDDKRVEGFRLDSARIVLKGRQDYYFLRLKWSWSMLALLLILVVFQLVLTVLIGSGVLNFEKYQAYLKIQICEFFGQVISMCVVIVVFLFPNNGKPKAEGKSDESSSR